MQSIKANALDSFFVNSFKWGRTTIIGLVVEGLNLSNQYFFKNKNVIKTLLDFYELFWQILNQIKKIIMPVIVSIGIIYSRKLFCHFGINRNILNDYIIRRGGD